MELPKIKGIKYPKGNDDTTRYVKYQVDDDPRWHSRPLKLTSRGWTLMRKVPGGGYTDTGYRLETWHEFHTDDLDTVKEQMRDVLATLTRARWQKSAENAEKRYGRPVETPIMFISAKALGLKPSNKAKLEAEALKRGMLPRQLLEELANRAIEEML